MSNNYYTDLDNDFPNAIDAYEPISDVTDATYELAHRYQAYINQGSNTYGGQYTGFQLAAQLKLSNPELEKMDVTAKKLNRMQQMIISLQRFTRSLKLQTVLSLNEPSGAVKQVVGSIWGKITNTLSTGEHKVTLKLKETENSYVDYYPKTTADQVLYLDGKGGTVDGETKLKAEIKKIKDVYHVETYTDISQLGVTSYKLTDIIKAMPDNSWFIAGYKSSSPYVSQNSLPTDNGVIKIVRTTLARTDLEVTSVVDNGGKYVHYHAVYNSSNNTISDWHEVSYSDHVHDKRYYKIEDIDTKTAEINKKIDDGITNIKTEITTKIDTDIKDTKATLNSTISQTAHELAFAINSVKEDTDNTKYSVFGGTIEGNVAITGGLTVGNATSATDVNIYGSHLYLHSLDNQTIFNRGIRSEGDGIYNCGWTNFRWEDVYCKNSALSTSDRKDKREIKSITNKYDNLFLDLKPVSYKFKDGDRVHIGFIAQDVEKSMDNLNMTSTDFAGFCKDKVKTPRKNKYAGMTYEEAQENGCTSLNEWHSGNDTYIDNSEMIYEDDTFYYKYALRYEEFIALNTQMIQKLMHKVDELEVKCGIKSELEYPINLGDAFYTTDNLGDFVVDNEDIFPVEYKVAK